MMGKAHIQGVTFQKDSNVVGFNYHLVLSSLFLAKLQELATLNLANPFAIAP
jgi:hypothetical protein